MFSRIPIHVYNICNQLSAQEELNKLMRKELVRVQNYLNTISENFEQLHATTNEIPSVTNAGASINKEQDLNLIRQAK